MDPERWARGNVRVFRDRAGASLAELYRAADLLVLPSTGEAFRWSCRNRWPAARQPSSAATRLLPCLASTKVLFSETVDADHALPAWHRHLTALLADPQRLTGRRREVADWAAMHWSWERCADAYCEVIREVLERRR